MFTSLFKSILIKRIIESAQNNQQELIIPHISLHAERLIWVSACGFFFNFTLLMETIQKKFSDYSSR